MDKEVNRLRHWTVEDGERVLHLESFIEDLDAAWAKFSEEIEQDAILRQRVLARAREKPPLGVRGGAPVQSSVEVAPGISLTVAGFNPTHFTALSASAASWPTTPPQSPPNDERG